MESKSFKILIVDDIEDNRLIIKRICRKLENTELLEAENGQVAVDMVREHEPEIVLMDIMMPVMDGFEATTIIKGDFPDTHIIIITALMDENTEKSLLKLGVDGYLRKPLARGVLKVKLEGLLAALKIKNGTSSILSSKHTLNPFNKNIRKMKTIFDISSVDDMMNLGLWLSANYAKQSAVTTMDFDFTLDTIYQFIKNELNNKRALSVIVEEDFESFYLNFICQNPVHYNTQEITIENKISQNVIFKDDLLHIKIDMKCDYQPTALMAEDLLNSALASMEYSEADFLSLESTGSDLHCEVKEIVISAEDFAFSLGQSTVDAIKSLEFTEELFESILSEFQNTKSNEQLKRVAKDVLPQYIGVINSLDEFETLAYGLSTTSLFLRTADAEHVARNYELILSLLCEIASSLKAWRKEIFIDKSAIDIHNFDNSLFFICMQIDGAIKLEVN